MNKLMVIAGATLLAGVVTGCATGGLSKDAEQDVVTKIWYDNADILVEANDPDLKADAYTGVTSVDAIVDTVKDILVQVPVWTVAKVEQKHFDSAYMEAAKAINGGADGADLVVKGEAFKTVLLFDTFAQEVAHADAAAALPKDQRKGFYEKNEEVYNAASAKCVDYANNQIFVLQSCMDDAARNAFFADASRAHWNERTAEIVGKIKACIAKADNEAAAKAAIAKLCRDMGVKEFDWTQVAALLAQDLEKINKAIQDLAAALQEPTLQSAIVKAAFGGEVVPGTSGKETLAAINRFRKQLTVNAKLISWLMKSLVV